MKIVDKALVDEIPKIFIMMLLCKCLDFLAGGDNHRTSLLTEVQMKCRTAENKAAVLVKSREHEEMVRNLKNRRKICENIIAVINQAEEEINNLT